MRSEGVSNCLMGGFGRVGVAGEGGWNWSTKFCVFFYCLLFANFKAVGFGGDEVLVALGCHGWYLLNFIEGRTRG